VAVNGFREQRLSGTGISNDHEGLSCGGELRDSRLESGDGRAATYDFQRVQDSGPDVRDKMEVTGSNRLARRGFSRLMVSGLSRSLDSWGLFRCVYDEA